jgi:hypothetical protein
MAGTYASEATPFFERLCPAMTKSAIESETIEAPGAGKTSMPATGAGMTQGSMRGPRRA